MDATKKRQRGAASLEFGLAAALVLAPLLLGLVDFGRYLSVGNVVSRAAHEGALTASRGSDPSAIVRTCVTSAGLDANKLTVSTSPAPAGALRGDSMQVTVSYNLSGYALATWGGLFPQSVVSRATARHE